MTQFPKEITNIIIGYANTKHLFKWFSRQDLDFAELSTNPNAEVIFIEEFEKNEGKRLDFSRLSGNKGAINILLKEYLKGIYLPKVLSANTGAREILELEYKKNDGKYFDWYRISKNSCAGNILREEYKRPNSRIDLFVLSDNSSVEIENIFVSEYKKNGGTFFVWRELCFNPAASKILELEYENNPNSERLNWKYLSGNPGAKKLLEIEYHRNGGIKFHWNFIICIPCLFDLCKIEYKKKVSKRFPVYFYKRTLKRQKEKKEKFTRQDEICLKESYQSKKNYGNAYLIEFSRNPRIFTDKYVYNILSELAW